MNKNFQARNFSFFNEMVKIGQEYFPKQNYKKIFRETLSTKNKMQLLNTGSNTILCGMTHTVWVIPYDGTILSFVPFLYFQV